MGTAFGGNIFNLASVFRKSSLLRVPGQPGNQGKNQGILLLRKILQIRGKIREFDFLEKDSGQSVIDSFSIIMFAQA